MQFFTSSSPSLVSSSFLLIGLLGSMVVGAAATIDVVASSMESEERLRGYKERGYEWPIRHFVPNTPGWNQLMTERLEQVASIPDPVERFKGYTSTLYPALVIQNYTEFGFGLSRISDMLLEELQQGIKDGFENNRRNEGYTPTITGNQAQHIQRDDLTAKVEAELHEKLEEWGDIALELKYVYGLRLFRNQTTIKMHIDKKGSHALGYVLHVGSSNDYDGNNDPWPFLIEDFHGRTHEVFMQPGDLIFFESAKSIHGRPHKLNASWYCNVVGHYYPTNNDPHWSSIKDHVAEAEYAVPPSWINDPPVAATGGKNKDSIKTLEFRGGLHEPECTDGWCRSSSSSDNIKWNGPVDVIDNNHWIDATGKQHKFVGRNHPKIRNIEEL